MLATYRIKRGETFSLQIKGRETGVVCTGKVKAAASNGVPSSSAATVANFTITDSTFDGANSWLAVLDTSLSVGKYVFDFKRASGGQTDVTDPMSLVIIESVTP